MIEKRDNQARLLADTLHEGWNEGPGARFAGQAAALARRRRRLRQALLTTGATAIAAGLIAISLFRSAPTPDLPQARKFKPAYDIISDDEFLAQISDRPVLVLHKENGTREFILLTATVAGEK